MEAGVSREDPIFFNCSFDKKRLKALISWVFKQSGEAEALRVVDLLKETGFRHATKAGISIGLHDLMTPIQKSWLISESQLAMNTTESDFVGARITATERSQRIVDTWHRASESLSKEVVDYFGIYDRFNPVYVMALSGARGNFSQVRQLIGMRGLMADQQGKIVNFPIRSNLREGLTLTEYFISCSGARKGLVDTALRTADTGYLTRRLVDVSHHVVVKRVRCNTDRGILFKSLQSYNKVLLPLKERLVGRVLAEDVFSGDTLASSIEGALPLKTRCKTVAKRDQEVSLKLALTIAKTRDKVFLRSPLTCGFTHSVCQLCYGWSISQGSLVSLGDAVGVIAAQSIGEPGTQLTMRTFHTGGVFSGDLLQEIRAPHAGKIEFSKAFQGLLIRTAHGRIAFLSKTEGRLVLRHGPTENENSSTSLSIPAFTMLFVRQGERVENNQLLAEYSIRTKEGNQPIKTQQTIFAQLSGRVVEDCSGKVYTRSIKESRLLLHTLENGELPPPASYGEPLPPLQGVYSSGARSCKGAVRQTAKRAIPPYTTFFEGGTFHLYHPPQMKKWRVQPLRLQGNNPPLSQIQSLNVPHSVQDRAVQEIFATRQSSVRGIRYSEHQDARLGRLSTLSKRFAFLNETRKKPFSLCKASLFSVHRDEDLENDAFKDVEPVRSGRLGFLKIVSIRVGATLDYISPTKPFDSSLKRRRGFDSFGARYLHPDCQKANRFLLQTVAEYGDVVEEGYALPTPEMTPIG